MIVTFTTKAYADTIMFGDIALKMLTMMGHSATVPGAILAADIPAYLQRLKAAINTENTVPTDVNKKAAESSVSLAQRAFPLLELLAAAAKAEADVMWK
ncbi:DUF1840 domain-containing protein [Methylomonas sp. AM2-LC]|uniref:DUF1840 domain-containing protein n=1 Tax=Methylomonas sp. AM2-LC TaxID=3153301 RepID=UPI0032646A7C